MRQIVLDTETTGLDPAQGHRVIEIGCVELVNRRLTRNRFHYYLQPDRAIDPGAMQVHGITDEDLLGKPRFPDIAAEFIEFIRDAELIIHNAAFDVGFLNHELQRLGQESLADLGGSALTDLCKVQCSLVLARQLHPGQKNSLDALCRRYAVDNSQRQLHGALLDAEILADVYLAMTGGQATLSLDPKQGGAGLNQSSVRRLNATRASLPVSQASAEELAAHRAQLELIDKASGGQCVWKKREAGGVDS